MSWNYSDTHIGRKLVAIVRKEMFVGGLSMISRKSSNSFYKYPPPTKQFFSLISHLTLYKTFFLLNTLISFIQIMIFTLSLKVKSIFFLSNDFLLTQNEKLYKQGINPDIQGFPYQLHQCESGAHLLGRVSPPHSSCAREKSGYLKKATHDVTRIWLK